MTDQAKALLPVTPELLPCPFCGTVPTLMPDDSYGHCGIGCHCEAEPFVQARKDEPEKAITAWNTRSQSHSLPGEREALEIAADALNGCEYVTSGDVARAGAALAVIRAALTPSPCPGDGMDDLLADANAHYSSVQLDEIEMRAALEAWSESTIMRVNDRDIPEREIAAEHGSDVAQAAALTRAALTPSPCPGDVGMRERDRWTLEELLDDIEDEWIDHYLRPDSAERAKCKRCGGDDFDKSSIDHKGGCLVGRIREARAALTPSAPASLLDFIGIEVERDEAGKVMICTGCGSVETIASIKSRHATAFSCCPERKMVRATPSALSGDAGEAMSKRTLVLCVSGKGPTPYLEIHFANLADAHAAHNELLGIKGAVDAL